MREMTATEMENVLASANWATICTVSPDGTPYAIEATPFRDGGDICFMINPRGGVHRNLAKNPAVLLKFTRAGRDLSGWAGVSCMGTGRFDGNPEAIRRGFDTLGRIMKADYAEAARKHSRDPERSPLLRVSVRETTGRCSGTPKATAQETASERTERAAR
jgi:nitroimidazol reductase NimA-like FMN-containing flavoprotein (pyridoxamine 5'-phosphate oxidase superfamily)